MRKYTKENIRLHRDFPELENIPFQYVSDGASYTAIAIGLNRDIGLTIVEKDDTGKELLCFNSTLSPYNKGHMPVNEQDNKTFDLIILGIQEGYVDFNIICEESRLEVSFLCGPGCAFK